jgi:hypothetical protein
VKGFVYYRCSNIPCPTTCVREDRIDSEVREILSRVTLNAEETAYLRRELNAISADDATWRAARRTSLGEALGAVKARLSRLTDLLVDAKISSEEHHAKREGFIIERMKLEQNLAEVDRREMDVSTTSRRIVELAENAETLYESADIPVKRQLLEIVMSNCIVSGKNVEFSLREPFATIANRRQSQSGGQLYDTALTFSRQELATWGDDWPAKAALALQNTA